MAELPALKLRETPIRHSHCCLSLSTTLFNVLTENVIKNSPTGAHVLSVGSGTGLLEALWLQQLKNTPPASGAEVKIGVEGVEVEGVNRYLPEEAVHTVRGTWDRSPHLRDVTSLLFVYPRRLTLVDDYMGEIHKTHLQVDKIIWLGPVADWADFQTCFDTEAGTTELTIHNGREIGLDEYEMMAVWRKRHKDVDVVESG